MRAVKFNKSPWLLLTGFGIPVFVLWLSMNVISNRVTFFSQADLANAIDQDKGEIVWIVNTNVPLKTNESAKVNFRMNSMETDVDSVMLRLKFPKEGFEVKTITSGIFGVTPEYVIDKNDLYLTLNNISVQGSGDLFNIELANLGGVAKMEFVKEDSYVRTKSGRIILDLPEVNFVKI